MIPAGAASSSRASWFSGVIEGSSRLRRLAIEKPPLRRASSGSGSGSRVGL